VEQAGKSNRLWRTILLLLLAAVLALLLAIFHNRIFPQPPSRLP
jgi:hypothetical protein